MAAVGAVLGIGSIISSSIAASDAKADARRRAKAARESGKRARESAENNARMLEELGVTAAADERKITRSLIAQQEVAFARNGVGVGTGSSLDVMLDASIEGTVKELRTRFGFDSAAYRERVSGILSQLNAEATGSLIQGAGDSAALNTILGGVTQGLGQIGNSGIFSSTGGGGAAAAIVPTASSFGPDFTLPQRNVAFGSA